MITKPPSNERRAPTRLGMYVHTHWSYHRPYAARTWTLTDWTEYLGGLAALGYNFLMIWPLLDCLPPEPTASDRRFLEKLGQVIDLAHDRFGFRVAVVAAANVSGNEQAAAYEFETRPYWLCEKRVNPGEPAEVRAFLAGRHRQLEPLARADALAIIDSDPGGWIGSTDEDFVELMRGQIEAFRMLNPRAELIYWMWFGWEAYNRFWQKTENNEPNAFALAETGEFLKPLRLMRERIAEPWWVYACRDAHFADLAALGLQDKAHYFPYGLIEGEPTFPFINYGPAGMAAKFPQSTLKQAVRGSMANAQTHCLQLPHTYLFTHLAGGGTMETIDLTGFADELLPGEGPAVARGWLALQTRDAGIERSAAKAIHKLIGRPHRRGRFSGLLFGEADRFLTDLAMNLEVRADLVEMTQAIAAGGDPRQAIRKVLDSFLPYQRRIGFGDAYGGPLRDELHPALARLDDPAITAVLGQYDEWRDVSVRNGILLRLLEAVDQAGVGHPPEANTVASMKDER